MKFESITYRRELIALLVFTLVLVFGISFLSILVDRDAFHTGPGWRPFDVHPFAFVAGIFACLANLMVIVRLAYRRNLNAVKLAILAALSLLSLGLCVAATVPGAGSVAIRDVISPIDLNEELSPFGFAVLFENNSDRLSSMEAAALKRQIAIFRECATSRISLRGFASSAAYRSASDDQNFALANRRAMSVSRFLKSQGLNSEIHIWNNFSEMRSAKRVVDVDEHGDRLLKEEIRNRRVEIVWHGSPCSGL